MIDLSKFKMRVTETQVLFWGGPASQWFKSSFEGHLPYVSYEGGRRSLRRDETVRRFDSGEKFMMMGKASIFNDEDSLTRMIPVSNTKDLKALGQLVIGFEQPVWNATCVPVVSIGNYYKFAQDDELFEFLQHMGDREFVEGSPFDRIWGVGMGWDNPRIEDRRNWRGTNLLGISIHNARDMISMFGRDADPFFAYGQLMRMRASVATCPV